MSAANHIFPLESKARASVYYPSSLVIDASRQKNFPVFFYGRCCSGLEATGLVSSLRDGPFVCERQLACVHCFPYPKTEELFRGGKCLWFLGFRRFAILPAKLTK